MKTLTHFKTSKTLYLKIAAMFLLVAGLASCKKTEEPIGTAYVQVINADELSLPQDFYVDGAKKNTTPIAYNQTSGFISLSSEDHQAQLKTASTETVNASFNMSPAANAYYSLFYLGTKTAAYSDDPTPGPAGKAKVRFINLTTSVTGDVDFGITGGAKLSTGLIQYLATDYYIVDPTAKFSVYTANTNTIILDIPIVLQAGKVYTIYATGSGTVTYNAIISNP